MKTVKLLETAQSFWKIKFIFLRFEGQLSRKNFDLTCFFSEWSCRFLKILVSMEAIISLDDSHFIINKKGETTDGFRLFLFIKYFFTGFQQILS
ncbi:MAG: hypothetical protein ABIS01_08585 [Ferruginibacter sp.]